VRSVFDKLTDRRGSGSLKWDVAGDELPMWVADMDFRTAPSVIRAVQRIADAGIYGYATVPDSFGRSIADWWRRRHDVEFDPGTIAFATGVVPAISSIVRSVTNVGDNVLIQPPVYNIFTNSIVNNARHVVTNDLAFDGDRYAIDFDDLEHKLADPQTTMMILCNPQNPVGAAWTRQDLVRIGEFAAVHDVVVLSDEVHCDLTVPGATYTPFAAASPDAARRTITCVAPSKAFNLAGLHSAGVIIPNPELRARVVRGLNTDEVAEPNAFAIDATIAAFTHGEAWLEKLVPYLQRNRERTATFLEAEAPQLRLIEAQATYLAWIDGSALFNDSTEFCRFLREETGLILSAGTDYGAPGRRFLRMNLACPVARLEDGLARLARGAARYRPQTPERYLDPAAQHQGEYRR